MDHIYLRAAPSGLVGPIRRPGSPGRSAWLRPDGIAKARATGHQAYTTPLTARAGLGRFTPRPGDSDLKVRGQAGLDSAMAATEFWSLWSRRDAANADEQMGVVAMSTEKFGARAVELWPDGPASTCSLALFVSEPFAPRVGLDLDGSLESLDNTMDDLADVLEATGEPSLGDFEPGAARSTNETRIAFRRLWALYGVEPRSLHREAVTWR